MATTAPPAKKRRKVSPRKVALLGKKTLSEIVVPLTLTVLMIGGLFYGAMKFREYRNRDTPLGAMKRIGDALERIHAARDKLKAALSRSSAAEATSAEMSRLEGALQAFGEKPLRGGSDEEFVRLALATEQLADSMDQCLKDVLPSDGQQSTEAVTASVSRCVSSVDEIARKRDS